MKRIQKLQEVLKEQSCDGLLVEDPINLYYLTGQDLSTGTLLVHKGGAELIVDGRYFEICEKNCSFPVHLAKNHETLKSLLQPFRLMAFDSQNTSYHRFVELEKMCQLKPLYNPVAKLRAIKDPEEIVVLQEAAKLGSEGYDYVCGLLKEGITEVEIATELEIFWKQRGGKKPAFDPMIAFGSNSSMPHHRTGQVFLKKGQPVLIDIGVILKHYHSDMTRVVFFGDPDPKMGEIYEIVRQAQAAALNICHPGTKLGDLDKAARDYIEQAGYGEHFTHSLGHGIGLEIHEYPLIRNKPPYHEVLLEPNMVITIEPGIYLPGTGGVRIEDTIVITKDGHKNLTDRAKDLNIL